jgi:hypothetical protein
VGDGAAQQVWRLTLRPIEGMSGECVSARRVEKLAMIGILVIIGFAVLLVAPCIVAASVDLDEEDAN